MADHSADVPQHTPSPPEAVNPPEIPPASVMPGSSNTQVSQIPISLPSWLSHSPLTYYQNLWGLIPSMPTPAPPPNPNAGPSATVPMVATTNNPCPPRDVSLPPSIHLSTPTSQPDYHAHYQAQFQAITTQLAAIQQTQIQLAQLVNSQTNHQNMPPADRPNEDATSNPRSITREKNTTADQDTNPIVGESSCSTSAPRRRKQRTSHQMSGRNESKSAQNLARQVADLKQEIKELGKPGKDA